MYGIYRKYQYIRRLVCNNEILVALVCMNVCTDDLRCMMQ